MQLLLLTCSLLYNSSELTHYQEQLKLIFPEKLERFRFKVNGDI